VGGGQKCPLAHVVRTIAVNGQIFDFEERVHEASAI